MANCIECESPLVVPSDVMQGEIVPCGSCGVEHEVQSVEPLTVGAAPAVMEDWGE